MPKMMYYKPTTDGVRYLNHTLDTDKVVAADFDLPADQFEQTDAPTDGGVVLVGRQGKEQQVIDEEYPADRLSELEEAEDLSGFEKPGRKVDEDTPPEQKMDSGVVKDQPPNAYSRSGPRQTTEATPGPAGTNRYATNQRRRARR